MAKLEIAVGMKRLLRLFYLVPVLCGVLSANGAETECIDSDPKTGTSKAVVVEPVPLAHTTQIFASDKSDRIVEGDATKQAEQVLQNLDSVLRAAKSDLQKTVKLNVYLAKDELRLSVSSVIARTFNGNTKPAITYVGGDLPHAGALVAMDAVATSKLKTSGAALVHFPSTIGNASQVTLLPPEGAVYVAGLADKNELSLATSNTLAKIETAINHLGLKKGDIVQLKAFVQPMSEVDKVKKAVGDYFKGGVVPPVIYVDWISASVPVEIEAIAAAPASVSEETVTYHTPTGTTASPVYSRLARLHGGKRIYISGLTGQSTAEQDVRDIYKQLDDIIAKTGTTRDHLVKATYYYSDPASNARLDAFRPKYYNPKTPPTASKSRAKDVGEPGKGIVIDMIAVTK